MINSRPHIKAISKNFSLINLINLEQESSDTFYEYLEIS